MGQALAIGDVLRGKYRLERILGRGGMGTVHLATHLVLGQRVAIKIVNPSAEDREYVVARFLREARAAALLESEHVVRILDVDVDPSGGGAPFMVMEYLQGADLGAVLRKGGRLPIPEAVGYVLEACEALAEAHAAGIVHRDLKPSNLFRTETARREPVIKLLDFGISKLAGPGEDLTLTDTHSVMGSPLFISPEQLLSSRDVDLRTDVWSIGVSLYQLVSGALPFEASTASALGAQIAVNAPRPLSVVFPEVPRDLEAAVMRCLARAPADRFASVVELARALAPFGGAAAPEMLEACVRAAERGAKGRPHAAPGEELAWMPPAGEASGDRWTRSQAGGKAAVLEMSSVERRSEVTKPAEEMPVPLGMAVHRPWRRGTIAATVAGVTLTIASMGVLAVSRMKRPSERAPAPSVMVSSDERAIDASASARANAKASTSTSASTSPSASASAHASASASGVPTKPASAKPGAWSRDPSELDLK